MQGELVEEAYVDQIRGYEKKGSEEKVYRLYKSLYGLKQAPRAWFSRIERYFLKEGFEKSSGEHALFVKKDAEGNILIVSVYVDDLLYTGNNEQILISFKESMQQEFDMTDLGRMKFFLGIEVHQLEHGIFICQRKYISDVLDRFGMGECKSVKTPMVAGQKLHRDSKGVAVNDTYYKKIVGCLIYLTTTRPDIMFAVSLISRFMSNPKAIHYQAAKQILRYLKGTLDYGLLYKRKEIFSVIGFTNSDYVRDLEDRKSTSGFVFFLNDSVIAWSIKKQTIVALSTTEAKFVAATSCACQGMWFRSILEELGYPQKNSMIINCDNNSVIKLSKNPIMHG